MAEMYDIAIVGGGIVGSSLLYVLTKYTDTKRVVLLEKERRIGAITSSSTNNSQTLHEGDIEASYSTDKAIEVKKASSMLQKYLLRLPAKERNTLIQPVSKMIIGIGDEEIERLDKKYDKAFLKHYPGLKRISKKELSRIEPNVVKGRPRDENVEGMYSRKGYMVNFGEVARSFIANSKGHLSLSDTVRQVRKLKDGYLIKSDRSSIVASSLIITAGTHSMHFAKSLGYAKDFSMLPIAGNFYKTPRVLNSKVYTLQRGKIPFLGIHGDPDINDRRVTRFGPTITLYPYTEKGRPSTFSRYLSSMGFDADLMRTYMQILRDKDLMDTFSDNLMYSVPGIGKQLFVQNEINRIVPALRPDKVSRDKASRGIRPQIIDKKERRIMLGEAEIKDEGLIVNLSPSPGASSCMKSALGNATHIADYLGIGFAEDRFERDFAL